MSSSTSTSTSTNNGKSHNPLGRPAAVYSRRKFQEAVCCLKGILRVAQHPAHIRLRACELLLACYGVPFPGSDSRATAASVKELVSAHTWERQLNRQLELKLAAEQEAAATQADQEAQEQQRRVFEAVLAGKDE